MESYEYSDFVNIFARKNPNDLQSENGEVIPEATILSMIEKNEWRSYIDGCWFMRAGNFEIEVLDLNLATKGRFGWAVRYQGKALSRGRACTFEGAKGQSKDEARYQLKMYKNLIREYE